MRLRSGALERRCFEVNGFLRAVPATEEGAGYVWPGPPCKDFGTRKDNAFKAVPVK